jgi:nicotinamide riboside kinase
VRKISITGPESSGKTTLAIELARFFSFTYVPEFSREFLQGGGKIGSGKDLVSIAKYQMESEYIASQSSETIICDTDILVLKIWNQEKFEPVHPAMNALYKYHTYDYTLLCAPDILWEPDSLRENPTDRDRLFVLYKTELQLKHNPFDIISGQGYARFELAKDLIKRYLQLA